MPRGVVAARILSGMFVPLARLLVRGTFAHHLSMCSGTLGMFSTSRFLLVHRCFPWLQFSMLALRWLY